MTDNRCKSKSVQSFSHTARIALNYICAFPSAKSPAHSTGGGGTHRSEGRRIFARSSVVEQASWKLPQQQLLRDSSLPASP